MQTNRSLKWDNPLNFLKYSSRLTEAYTNTIDVKEEFENILLEESKSHPECEYYLSNGCWRDSGDPDESSPINHMNTLQSQQCYYNAQTSLNSELTYAEGYIIMMPPSNEQQITVVAHAWLERDGEIIELDPEINQSPHLYFGAAFENQEVHSILTERGHASPIVEAKTSSSL